MEFFGIQLQLCQKKICSLKWAKINYLGFHFKGGQNKNKLNRGVIQLRAMETMAKWENTTPSEGIQFLKTHEVGQTKQNFVCRILDFDLCYYRERMREGSQSTSRTVLRCEVKRECYGCMMVKSREGGYHRKCINAFCM